MAEKINLDSKYDLKDNYEASDSEDEYSEEEKELLKNVRRRGEIDASSEEEVYGFSDDSDDEDKNADIADSDVEGQEGSGDDLPDVRAWGKKKRDFYSTDYVDQDYGGFGKDEEIAKLEEEEARALQKKLAEQLGDDDYSLEFFTSKKIEGATKDDKETEIVKSDLTQMSKRQKLQLLNKESPEFAGLVEDFKEKMLVANQVLKPIKNLVKQNALPKCSAMDFVQTYYEIILNYCTNISFYLLLKTKRISIQSHPVTKRLYQYRQILTQMEPIYENTIKPQLECILEAIENNKIVSILSDTLGDTKISKKRRQKEIGRESKKLKLIDNINMDNEKDSDESDESDEEEQNMKNDNILNGNVEEDESETNLSKLMSGGEMSMDEGEKRAITYQMAKNKGLTPKRKKEQRNPRVKHRNKYRKAKIRRKGAIREVRTETSRYAGEISGIKSNVKKSIKIK